MTLTLAPIETVFKGYRFRSRLEARWAVFFSELKLQWEYEKQGYLIDNKGYLPDFWIESWQCWVEIKPATDDGILKGMDSAKRLSYADYPVLLICGNPWPREYKVHVYRQGKSVVIGEFKDSTFKDFLGIAVVVNGKGFKLGNQRNVPAALARARAARFEHGESG